MNWINLDSKEKLDEVTEISQGKRVLILKYSHNESVDYIVRMLLEREWNEGEMRIKTFLLDTAANNNLAKQIDSEFGMSDETPQVLIIEKGKPAFIGLHGKVIYSEIKKFAN